MKLDVIEISLIAGVAVKETDDGILKHGGLIAEGILEQALISFVADGTVFQKAGVQVELAGSNFLVEVVVDTDTGIVAVPCLDGVAERAPNSCYDVIAMIGIVLATAVFT